MLAVKNVTASNFQEYDRTIVEPKAENGESKGRERGGGD